MYLPQSSRDRKEFLCENQKKRSIGVLVDAGGPAPCLGSHSVLFALRLDDLKDLDELFIPPRFDFLQSS